MYLVFESLARMSNDEISSEYPQRTVSADNQHPVGKHLHYLILSNSLRGGTGSVASAIENALQADPATASVTLLQPGKKKDVDRGDNDNNKAFGKSPKPGGFRKTSRSQDKSSGDNIRRRLKRGFEYYLRNEKIVWNLLGSSLYLNENKHKAFRAKIAEYITQESPDVICTISPNASHAAKLALQDTGKATTIPLVVVLADHGKVPYFRIVPEAALTIVSNEQSKTSVVSQGLAANKVEAVGPLVHKKFEDIMKTSKEELRKRLGKELQIPSADDTKVALLAGGSKGSIGLAPTLKSLLRARFANLHLIVLPGANEPLRKELQSIVDNNSRSSARILGYSDNMHELIRLSDFAITKAGGSSESQFLITRTPNIINDCVSLYEKLNRNYVKSTKSGYVAESPSRVVNVVRNILNNPEQLEEIIAVQEKIAPHGGAKQTADLLRNCANRWILQQGVRATRALAGEIGDPTLESAASSMQIVPSDSVQQPEKEQGVPGRSQPDRILAEGARNALPNRDLPGGVNSGLLAAMRRAYHRLYLSSRSRGQRDNHSSSSRQNRQQGNQRP